MPRRIRVNAGKIERAVKGLTSVLDTAAIKKNLSKEEVETLLKAHKILYDLMDANISDDFVVVKS
jgi:hypothetical protein